MLAGRSQFPLLLARAARAKGIRVLAVAHAGETEPAIAEWVDELIWVKLGQLQKTIDFFRERGVTEAVMAGGILKTTAYQNIEPDARALHILGRLTDFHDDGFLRAFADAFEQEGIAIRPSTLYTPELLAPEGILTRRRPTDTEREDIQFGWRIAKAVGRLDIGQCVVVRHRMVLAVEAIEGSDETIRRGGALGRGDAVVIKVSKPHQDLRFDLPSVGCQTIAVMNEVQAKILVIEAGKTLLFDRQAFIDAADQAGITVWARGDD